MKILDNKEVQSFLLETKKSVYVSVILVEGQSNNYLMVDNCSLVRLVRDCDYKFNRFEVDDDRDACVFIKFTT